MEKESNESWETEARCRILYILTINFKSLTLEHLLRGIPDDWKTRYTKLIHTMSGKEESIILITKHGPIHKYSINPMAFRSSLELLLENEWITTEDLDRIIRVIGKRMGWQ